MGHNALRIIILNYTLNHKSCKENGHANGLSWGPLAKPPKNTSIPEDIVNFKETSDKGPVNAQQIKERTGRHPVMAKVRHCFLMGYWLSTCMAQVLPFFSRKHVLSVEDGCILWGCRVTSFT